MTQVANEHNHLPTLLQPNFDNIPGALQRLGWAFSDPINDDGKSAKAPRNRRGRLLSPANGEGWVSFVVAQATMDAGLFLSCGVRLDGTGIVGIDLDHYQEKAAQFPELSAIVNAAIGRGVYIERSPSGTGRRAFVYGKPLPIGVHKTEYGIEIYSHSRYLRVTGHKHRASQEVTQDQQFIDELLDLIGRGDVPSHTNILVPGAALPSPDVIARIAEKVANKDSYLWSGNLAIASSTTGEKYGPSEADLALCSVIRNVAVAEGVALDAVPAVVEEVMNRSGLAQIEHGDGTQKWLDRQDYRERTIARACANMEVAPVVLKREAGVDQRSLADFELAERFVHATSSQLCYVRENKSWLKWSGSSWEKCARGEEIQAIKSVIHSMIDDAAEVSKTDPERGQRLYKTAMNLQREQRIMAALRLATTEPSMTRLVSEFNADSMLLGVQNGVVDLRTGKLLEAQPKQLISKQCTANYRPNQPCSQWQKFLDDVFCGDQELIASVQRAVGYSMTGSNTEERLFICYGNGANGKSIFFNIVSRIMGDYSTTALPDILVQKSGGGSATPELAALVGIRMFGINETATGDRLDERMLKVLAGREAIAARPLYGTPFNFVPEFSPWLRTNHKPVITGTDFGVWRRIALIPFRRQFTEGERDDHIEQKLWAERDGILAWAVAGAVEWSRGGLRLCRTIEREVQAYRQESDLLAQFLDEITEPDPVERVEQATLYGAWSVWCQQNGVKVTAKASFTRRLAEVGHAEAKSNGRRFYSGLRLRNHMLTVPLPQ